MAVGDACGLQGRTKPDRQDNYKYVDQNYKYFDRNDIYQVWLESRPKKDHIACSPNGMGGKAYPGNAHLKTFQSYRRIPFLDLSIVSINKCKRETLIQIISFDVIFIDLPLSFRPM